MTEDEKYLYLRLPSKALLRVRAVVIIANKCHQCRMQYARTVWQMTHTCCTYARARCTPNYNTRKIFRNSGVGAGDGDGGAAIPLKRAVIKNKIDMWRRCQWMENLPTKGNTRARRNAVIYFTIYSEYIWIFRRAPGEGGQDIPGEKFARTKRALARARAHEYEVFASASCIVSDNETISPS